MAAVRHYVAHFSNADTMVGLQLAIELRIHFVHLHMVATNSKIQRQRDAKMAKHSHPSEVQWN